MKSSLYPCLRLFKGDKLKQQVAKSALFLSGKRGMRYFFPLLFLLLLVASLVLVPRFTRAAALVQSNWSQLIPNGATGSPPARASNTMSAWDSVHNRWLIFGGYDAAHSSYFNDLWQYTSTNGWQQLTAQNDPTAPHIRTNHAVAWDTQANRLLVFGGYGGSFLNDLWQYTDAHGWQQLVPDGLSSSPGRRDDLTLVWDSHANRLLLFGGVAYADQPEHIYNDLWQYTDAHGWQLLTSDGNPASPPGRTSHAAAWDTQNNRLLVFSGTTTIPGHPTQLTNDLWEYTDAHGWRLLTPNGDVSSPPARYRSTAVWDSQKNRLLIFSGPTASIRFMNDLWQYTDSSGWTQLTAQGDPASPPVRQDQTAGWDTQNNRLLIFAGVVADGLSQYNDLWTYSDNAPTINPIFNVTLNEGDTYSANGSFTDSNSTSWTATVDYGDGSGVQPLTLSGMNFSLSHQYKDEGSYTVTVNVTDNRGATGTGTTTITVNNVVSSVGTITVPTSVGINTSLAASANFTDHGVLDTHTASWNWGDTHTTTGTVTESNGSGSVSNTHTYVTAGSFTITLSVTDDKGLTGTRQVIIAVSPSSGGSFAGVNLSGLTYSGANLSNQNISGSNLQNGIFNNVNFQNANLSGVNAPSASFQNANFTGANLSGSTFQGANFTNANITGANLHGANFKNTIVTSVTWSNTICPDGTNSDNDSGTCTGHGGGL